MCQGGDQTLSDPAAQRRERRWGGLVPTFLCRVDDGDGAEGPFPLVVVDAHFDLVGREGRQALVAEHVAGGIRRGHHRLHPADRAQGPEGHHVAKATPVLQLLGHRLWAGTKSSFSTHRPPRLRPGDSSWSSSFTGWT